MPEWLWYAALGFTLGSGLAWWLVMVTLARRERVRWQRWLKRDEEQTVRWAHVELCSACTAWRNEDNARLAALPRADDPP